MVRTLAEKLSRIFQRPKRTRTTPTRFSLSDGAVESANGHSKGQVRTLRTLLEMMHGLIVNPNTCIWTWLTHHSSWLMNWFSIQWSYGIRGCLRQRVERRLVYLWEKHFFSGKLRATLELWFGLALEAAQSRCCVASWSVAWSCLLELSFGVFLTRNVRRLPFEQRCAKDQDLVVAMRSVPWEPRQESKAGRPRRKHKSVARPLPVEPISPTAVALFGIVIVTRTCTTTTRNAAVTIRTTGARPLHFRSRM